MTRLNERPQPFPVIHQNECKGCNKCVISCKNNAIIISENLNDNGYNYAKYKGEGCNGCGDCYYVCPEPLAVEVHIPKKKSNTNTNNSNNSNNSKIKNINDKGGNKMDSQTTKDSKNSLTRAGVPGSRIGSQIIKGNTAVIIGAMYAGCDCFYGYPITPASEILHEASKYFPMVGRKFIQAESEEAAINMVYGGASTGHRVMTASSGPGISLKQEGMSYLAGAELPSVIVDIMRAGPGLGNIGPEQADYNQMVKGGGHGNYKNIVLAPNSVQEMCDLTMKAFMLADKYKTPVVVLADAVLGQMAEPLRFPEVAIDHKPNNSWAVRGNKETMENLVTSIFLDFDQLEEFNENIQVKYEEIEKNEVDFEEYMVSGENIDDAEIILVAYGISSRLARSAVDIAREEMGIKVGLLRPISLFPFPDKKIGKLAKKSCEFISVEMSNGQMREDIKLAANCAISDCKDIHLANKMGGNLIEVKDILEKIYDLEYCEKYKVNLAKEYPDKDDNKFDESYIDSTYKDEMR